MPLNERCLSSKFHGYDVESVQGLREKLATTLVEARPPFSAFVSGVATACVHINSLRCARQIVWTFFIVTNQ